MVARPARAGAPATQAIESRGGPLSTAIASRLILVPGAIAVGFAIVYLLLARSSEVWMVVLCAVVSFALYFYVGALVGVALRLAPVGRLIAAAVAPIAVAAILFGFDKASGPPKGGGFITLKFGWKEFWVLPGMFVAHDLV